MSSFPTSPLGGLPTICLVVSDNMSNGWERKVVTHGHHPIGRNAVQDRLTRVDRPRGIIIEDRRPLGVLQARHRIMGDVAHMHELLLAGGKQD
jgi:hypothetical protein